MDYSYGTQLSLQGALRDVETAVATTGKVNLRVVLNIAREECQFPELGVVWSDTLERDINGVQLCEDDDCVDPQTAGHALVQAAYAGYIHCVRALHAMQHKQYGSSFLTGRFCAYAFLKAVEADHKEVVEELLKPIASSSLAMMGYAVATMYKDGHYPYITERLDGAKPDWLKRLASNKAILPKSVPAFLDSSRMWELQAPKRASEGAHEAVRATYRNYFLWRAGLIAATNGNVSVFQVILKQLETDSIYLAENFHDASVDARKIMTIRTKIDSSMYQLIEELATIQQQDNVLFTLWSSNQCGSAFSPNPESVRPHPSAAGAHCVAKAENGLWQLEVDVPLLLMPLEISYVEEDAVKRLKQLTQLFTQHATVNVQLVCEVVMLPICVQVTISIKHVRFKFLNCYWEEERIGHFPSSFSISVTPDTEEGAGCTMSNSSSNVGFKVGTGERIQGSTSITVFATAMGAGARMGFGASAGKTASTTMKSQPWRFEQLPVDQDRGGSYNWDLIHMKGLEFNRLNPVRMAEVSSVWKFGRRVPVNPLAELPFSSEGGINFSGSSYPDTLMWRFPKSMDGTKLRWKIAGKMFSTFTTTKYWETRTVTFSGIIEETLKAVIDEKADKDKKDKKDKGEKDGDEKSEKKKKGKKEKEDEDADDDEKSAKKKKDKKAKEDEDADEDEKSVKKKKDKKPLEDEDADEDEKSVKKKKDKKAKEDEDADENEKPAKKKKDKKIKDEEDEAEDDAKLGEKKKDKKDKKDKKAMEEDEEEDEEPVKKKKEKKMAKEEHDEDDDVPIKKKKEKKAVREEDDEDAEVPVKKVKEKKPAKEEDDEDAEVPMKKVKEKKPAKEKDDEDDEVPMKKKKEKKPAKEEDEEDDDEPPVKTKKKVKKLAFKEEEEDEDDEVPVKKKTVQKKTTKEEEAVEEDEVSLKKTQVEKSAKAQNKKDVEPDAVKKGKKAKQLDDDEHLEPSVPVKKLEKMKLQEDEDDELSKNKNKNAQNKSAKDEEEEEEEDDFEAPIIPKKSNPLLRVPRPLLQRPLGGQR